MSATVSVDSTKQPLLHYHGVSFLIVDFDANTTGTVKKTTPFNRRNTRKFISKKYIFSHNMAYISITYEDLS